MWWEVCTNNEEDWKAFMNLCAKSWENTAFSRRYLPDREKRKLFLPHYFNYNYETKFSNGRAALVCLKTLPDGKDKPEMVLGSTVAFKPEHSREGDKSSMLEAYKGGTELVMKRDDWLMKNVHQPMRRAAESLGLVAWYGAYQGVSAEYIRHGLGTKYMIEAYELLHEEGLKLESSNHKEILPITYGLYLETSSSISKSRFVKAVNSSEIAHLHYNYRPGLKCAEDPTANNPDEHSCVHVLAWKPDSKYDSIILKMRKYFETPSAKF